VSVEFKRAQRVGQLIQQELGALFIDGLRDPRVGFVTVTEVRVTDDLKHARVFVSVYGSEAEREASIAGLRDAAGFLKREIGHRLKLRFTPTLSFQPDESLERAARVETLLSAIERGELEAPADTTKDVAPHFTTRSDLEASRKALEQPKKQGRPGGRRKKKHRYS
jgi:ribosome-binding factor A